MAYHYPKAIWLTRQTKRKGKALNLGKYYLLLKDNINFYIEFIPRLYPTKPPKGWTKVMMSKLDLALSDTGDYDD